MSKKSPKALRALGTAQLSPQAAAEMSGGKSRAPQAIMQGVYESSGKIVNDYVALVSDIRNYIPQEFQTLTEAWMRMFSPFMFAPRR